MVGLQRILNTEPRISLPSRMFQGLNSVLVASHSERQGSHDDAGALENVRAPN